MKLRHLLLALFWSPLFALAAEAPKITPAEAAKRVAAGTAVLVDVREASEWAETGVAAPAVLLPKSDFDGAKSSWTPFLKENAGKEVILYCRGGGRAVAVAEALAAKGMKVANVGGFRDWEKAGLPTRKAEEKK
jgi:rhodanese-related sulfurtransferase